MRYYEVTVETPYIFFKFDMAYEDLIELRKKLVGKAKVSAIPKYLATVEDILMQCGPF